MSYPWLDRPLTTTAYGWRMERRDGVTIGFTSHDRDVVIDGLVYRASPGIAPSSIVETIGLEVNSLEVSGALTSDAIRAEDVEAGKWDGADLAIFLFDWTDPAAPTFSLAKGSLGAVNWSGSAFEVEFLGPASRLSKSVVPLTSPTCRARFAGPGCNLNPQRFLHAAIVAEVQGDTVILTNPLTVDPTHFARGELRWTSGPNCGHRQQIVSATSTQLVLAEVPPFITFAPTHVQLLQGCDRTIATCSGRFGNAVNFRGEPFLPGNDLLTRYPGGG